LRRQFQNRATLCNNKEVRLRSLKLTPQPTPMKEIEMFTTSQVARMKKISVALLGAVVLTTAAFSTVSPALALGDCGPNGHRGPFGHCRWGGQNEAWCLRHTGHVATPGPGGTKWCVR
jgi:hypothetical protein